MVAAGNRHPNPALARRVSYGAVFACFFVSGFCSLLYQIVWTRLAFAHFGVITPVLSVVISVFMLGIGIGSYFGGRWAVTLNKRNVCAIYLYAVLEGTIAAGSVTVPRLFDWGESMLLRSGAAGSTEYLILSAAFMTLAVLPWTIAMGATIPAMMSFVRANDPGNKSSFSFLYIANVTGGVFGALAEAFVMIELLGIRSTYLLAGLANVAIAAFAIGIGRSYAAKVEAKDIVSGDEPVALQIAPVTRRWTLVMLFTTGFCSMGLEVSWARDFTFSLLTTIYAFASILAVYLLATALGSYAYRRFAESNGEFSFAAVVGWTFVAALLPVIFTDPRLGPSAPRSLLSIAPFCGLLGFLTPYLIDSASAGDPVRAGRYYGVNIVGSILGPLTAGYLLLPALGLRWTIVTLAAPFLAFFALLMKSSRSLGLAIGAMLVLGTSVFLSRAYDDPSLIQPPNEMRRDFVASVIASGTGMNKRLTVNSIRITAVTTITKVMAHLPMALNGHPKRALDICFGMGTTFRSLMTWGVDTTAVDLSKAVIDSFGFFYPDSAKILSDPRAHLVVDDGRRYLMRTSQTYDVITIDPPPPVEAAGSSLLYSKEMYRVLKPHLSPGGVLQQWIPRSHGLTLESVALALRESFPYVRVFRADDPNMPPLGGTYFIASITPIARIRPEQFIGRMPLEARRDLMEWEGRNTLEAVVAKVLADEIPLRSILPADSGVPALSDDRPFNEYFFLREHGL